MQNDPRLRETFYWDMPQVAMAVRQRAFEDNSNSSQRDKIISSQRTHVKLDTITTLASVIARELQHHGWRQKLHVDDHFFYKRRPAC